MQFWQFTPPSQKSCLLTVLLCLAVLPSSSPAYSQAHHPNDRASLGENTLRVDADMVLVPVTVSDGLDRPVMGLNRQSFALYEDNQQQNIRYFATEDAPISVALLIDLSKSMRSKFITEQPAVSEFFKNANSQDDYLAISFSDRPKILADTTDSIDVIESNLAAQRPDGNTALLDAVSFGETQMRTAQYRRKVLLIISDGGDNHSRHRMRQIKKMVQDSDIEVYALGIFDTGPFKSLEEYMGKRWIEQITSASGGATISVDRTSGLPEAAAKISREMRDRYILGYLPSSGLRDGRRRKIFVQVSTPNVVTPCMLITKRSIFQRKLSSSFRGERAL